MSSYAFFVQTCKEEHKKILCQHLRALQEVLRVWRPCLLKKREMWRYGKGWQASLWWRNENIPPKTEIKKKFKDPNKPKRPTLAFFLFFFESYPKIKTDHPVLSIGDVTMKLVEMWNNIAADDKQPYEKMLPQAEGQVQELKENPM